MILIPIWLFLVPVRGNAFVSSTTALYAPIMAFGFKYLSQSEFRINMRYDKMARCSFFVACHPGNGFQEKNSKFETQSWHCVVSWLRAVLPKE